MTPERLVTIDAEWPAPSHVRALTTTRGGGVSEGRYSSLNLATHVGDDPTCVMANRARVVDALQLPSEPCWLEQHHGTRVIDPGETGERRADGACTRNAGVVLAILTADCLPVLITNRSGTEIAALHGGWRGLAGNIIERSIGRLRSARSDLLAWLGPAIGAANYEVGAEVRAAFLRQSPALGSAFQPARPGHFLCNLYAIARGQLQSLGVEAVYGGFHCTYMERDRFFSYRRDGDQVGDTGRMATLIWMEPR